MFIDSYCEIMLLNAPYDRISILPFSPSKSRQDFKIQDGIDSL